jgi:DNA-binding response OmpR family regulator
MENAKVVYFEDSEIFQEMMTIYLKIAGHQVIHSAHTMDQARKLIDTLKPGMVNVAIVDGNLNSGHTGNDGREIVELLRAKDENIVIIGSSGDGEVEGADYQAPKSGSVTSLIPELIENIKK